MLIHYLTDWKKIGIKNTVVGLNDGVILRWQNLSKNFKEGDKERAGRLLNVRCSNLIGKKRSF